MKINYKHTLHTHNPTSAELLLPFVFSIVNPTSVLDVGCGNGSWLKVCKDLGVSDVYGVDGIQVSKEDLMIEEDKFLKYNLSKKLTLERMFDMVISLEVAEHLSETEADTFVDSLTSHSSVVLFSAAIPGQGGQFHLNEQWPKYWQEKFKSKGFEAYDILRSEFWDNENVLWWYQQNMMFFVKDGERTFSSFKPTENVLSLIHPNLYRKKIFKPKFLDTKKEAFKLVFDSLKAIVSTK
jgi:SAM-dependent methyltransferase